MPVRVGVADEWEIIQADYELAEMKTGLKKEEFDGGDGFVLRECE